jgi:ribonuclease HI
MIISSKAVFPKKAKKYALKRSKEEIEKEATILEREARLKTFQRKNIPKEKKEIKEYDFIIYTDGGYNQTYRVGSWSYFIKAKYGKKHFLFNKCSGVIEIPNKLPVLMELTAVIKAVQFIASKNHKKKVGYIIKSITVYSDNRQVIRNKEFFDLYKENNWFYLRKNYEMIEQLKTSWNELHDLNEMFEINYVWVRGHSGNLGNERCDEICTTRINQSIRVKRIIKYNSELL